jgi:hypothetical protein
MQKCPVCEYKTTNPKQMQKHIENTRHGQQQSSRKDRSHLRQLRTKKKD